MKVCHGHLKAVYSNRLLESEGEGEGGVFSWLQSAEYYIMAPTIKSVIVGKVLWN